MGMRRRALGQVDCLPFRDEIDRLNGHAVVFHNVQTPGRATSDQPKTMAITE